MDVSDLARLSLYHYEINNKPTNKHKKEIEKMFDGYKISPSSDYNVLGIYNDNKKDLVINHRGSKTAMNWTVTDPLAMMGRQDFSSEHNRRRKHTKQLIRDHDAKHITLTGHSLGSHTVLEALHKSPSLAKHVDKVHIFNGLSPAKYAKDPELHKKIQIHRHHNDVVSILKQPYKTKVYGEGEMLDPLEAHHLKHFIN